LFNIIDLDINKSIVSSSVDAEYDKSNKHLLEYLVIPDYCGEDLEGNNENNKSGNVGGDMCHIDDSFSH